MSSVCLRGRGQKQVLPEALQRELGARVTKRMLSKTPGSGNSGTSPTSGNPSPKWPQNTLSRERDSFYHRHRQANGRLETGRRSLDFSALIGPGTLLSTFPENLDGSRGLLWWDLHTRLPLPQVPRGLPFSRPRTLAGSWSLSSGPEDDGEKWSLKSGVRKVTPQSWEGTHIRGSQLPG